MNIVIASNHISEKLAGRSITDTDLIECFNNKSGKVLLDTREGNKTTPPTLWFIAATDAGRTLKVVFIYFVDSKEAHVKSAYAPNSIEINLYEKLK